MKHMAITIAALAALPADAALAVTQRDIVNAVRNAPAGDYLMPTIVVVLAAMLVILGMARVMKQS
jgi:hypothetical protein